MVLVSFLHLCELEEIVKGSINSFGLVFKWKADRGIRVNCYQFEELTHLRLISNLEICYRLEGY